MGGWWWCMSVEEATSDLGRGKCYGVCSFVIWHCFAGKCCRQVVLDSRSHQWLHCSRNLLVSHIIWSTCGAGSFLYDLAEASPVEGLGFCVATSSQHIAIKRQFDLKKRSSSKWQRLCWWVRLSGVSISLFFFRCNIFGSLWYLIYQWVGIFFISPVLVADRFHHFGHYVDLPRFTHAVMPTLSWFGMLLFGFFGRREITGFLRTLLKIWFSY